MQRADAPKDDRTSPAAGDGAWPDDADRASRSPVSVAILAAIACVPIVVAAGFLTDGRGSSAVPGDISVLALRGVLDGPAEARPPAPARAGY